MHGSSSATLLRIGFDTTITGVLYNTQTLVQYDTTGNMKWVRFVGENALATYAGTSASETFALVDGDDNIHYINTVKYGVPFTPTLVSHYGNYDLKYDVSGNLLSIKQFQLDSSLMYLGGGVINKTTGHLYVYGSRAYYMFPDSSRHPYVASFDTDRNLIWMDTLADNFNLAVFSGITFDNSDHIYLTGGTNDWVSYRGDTITQELPGAVSFILKIDTGGNPKWLKGFSGANSVNNLLNPSLTSNGNVVAGGAFRTKVVSGSDTLIEFPGETQNAHFVVLDTAGYIERHYQLHGFGSLDGIMCTATDRKGNIYLAGEVSNNIWAGSQSPYTSIGGNSDFFVMKYGVDCNCTSAPVAHFTDTGYLVRGFSYTGSTTPAIDSVRWYFGDGGTSTLLNPTHTYATADTFTACVRVYTACGSDLYCNEVRIPCITSPVPSFGLSGTGLTRTFTYTGTTTGVTAVSWSFSDGGSGSGTSTAHTFSAAGTYTVCASATNPCGTTTTCNPVTITCVTSPVSSFTVSAGAGLSKTFTYTGTTTGMDSVSWTFGDGGTATGSSPLHTYAAAGTYTVCATVYTNCGVHTYCNPVVVTCIAGPTASYSFTGTDLSRSFTYTGTTAGMDSVRWNFGDGITTSVVSPSHTFSAAGTYTVCVTVYTNCGSHTYCLPVTVTCIIPPVSSFTISGAGASRTFTYTGTTAGMDSVRWNFGDGGTSTLLNPSHVYTTEDTFHVCVTVYTNCGSHTSCQDIMVNCFLPITSAFTDTGMLVHGFAYTGTMIWYDSVQWNFGDGNTDTGLNVIHTYAVADTYHVCAKVFTDCGTHTSCRSIIIPGSSGLRTLNSHDIKVYPNPATNELFIIGLTERMAYRVMNVVGVTVMSGAVDAVFGRIEVGHFSAGVYVLQLTDGYGRRVVIRVVKE
ncbi:MAG: PKD domain-containing protein [Chitinophagaceae bacterium]|nr:PKD domain-containing protein [Chitinophagaceae bacterium]